MDEGRVRSQKRTRPGPDTIINVVWHGRDIFSGAGMGSKPSGIIFPPGVDPNRDAPLVNPGAAGRFVQCMTFDGHDFPVPIPAHSLPIFDLAYRARRGDVGAIALLTATGGFVRDVENKLYWPVKPADQAGQPSSEPGQPSSEPSGDVATPPAVESGGRT